MWSPRVFERGLYRCGQVEYEDVICAVDDVHLLTPRAFARGQSYLVRQLRELTMRAAKLDFKFQPRVEQLRVRGNYELFFFYAQSLHDLHLLKNLPGWRERVRKAVCVIEEVWATDIARGGVPRELAKFDTVAVGLQASVEALHSATKLRSLWVPPGTDTLRFFPGREPPTRSIDMFNMGRRSELAHAALRAESSQRGWTYLFDSVDPQAVRDGHREHRIQLAELVKRSRYFMVNKARVDAPERTSGQEELGFRSFEGAAGGAIMIGDTPRSPSVEQLFDWPDAHIHVAYDSTSIGAQMAELNQEPERLARIRRNNVVNSLRRHDWAHRWRAILDAMGMAPMAALQTRLDELEQAARAFETVTLPGG